MQGLVGPPAAFDLFTSESPNSAIPFACFMHYFPSAFSGTSPEEILGVYENLLKQTRSVLGIPESHICSHNLLMWKDWIIVIPRRKGAVGKASANAAGMLGSVWVPNWSAVDMWLQLGCKSVLEELGVPALGTGAANEFVSQKLI